MTLINVGLGLMAFIGASTLAIDVGMFMTARSQTQLAADAGALAGATALTVNDYDDRSPGGPAVLSAINTATANQVMAGAPSVLASDVTFPVGPTGVSNRVKVNVFRSGPRSNALPTLLGGLFGLPTVNLSATATAESSPANAMTCVKPFTIPDKWIERTDPPWTPDSTFDRYDKKGKLLANPDEYIPVGEPGYSGYNAVADKGTELTIRAGTGSNISPSFYFSWAMPGGTGGSFYESNISGCNTTIAHFGDEMTQEPGSMVGPTNSGVDALLAQDPGAYWDTAKNQVHSSMSPSPRIFPIPLFDPQYYEDGKTTGRGASLKMANWMGFFIERRVGSNVYGRITPIHGVIDNSAGPAPAGTFPYVIRLVQ